MKHLVKKIDFVKIKEQIKAMKFALPELIIGIVIGIVLSIVW